jgi:hypothetical protein
MAALAAAVAVRRLILVVLILVERVVLEVQTLTALVEVVLVVLVETPALRGRNL